MGKKKKKETMVGPKPAWWHGQNSFVWSFVLKTISDIKLSPNGRKLVKVNDWTYEVDDKGRWNRFVDKGPFVVNLSVRRTKTKPGVVHHFNPTSQPPLPINQHNRSISKGQWRVLGKISKIFSDSVEVRVFRNPEKKAPKRRRKGVLPPLVLKKDFAVPVCFDQSLAKQTLKIGDVVEGYGFMYEDKLIISGHFHILEKAPPIGAPFVRGPIKPGQAKTEARKPEPPRSDRVRVRLGAR